MLPSLLRASIIDRKWHRMNRCMFRCLQRLRAIALSLGARFRKPERPALPRAAFYTLVSLALAGPLAFQSTSTAASVLQNGYDLVRDAVSLLVFGPYGWLQTAAFYLFGVSLLALSIILTAKARVKINAGAIPLALLGAGFIMLGAHKGPEPGGTLGYSGLIHEITVIIVVLLFPVACFLLAPGLKAWGYRSLYIYTIAVGVFSALFMAIGGPVLALQYSLVGIFERILLWSGQLWLLVVCIHLLVDEVRRERQPAPVPVDSSI
jgi:hypothetical protein